MDNTNKRACAALFFMIITIVLSRAFCHADTKVIEGKIVGTGPNKVWMNVGTEAGAAVDMTFEVRRGDELVAKVKVKKAGKTSSEAEVIAIKEGMSCMSGDTVKSSGEVKTEPKQEEPKKEEPKKEEVKPADTTTSPTPLTPTVTASTTTPTTTPTTPAPTTEPKKEEPKKEEPKKEEPKKTETKPKAKHRSFWSRLKIKDALYVVLILGGTMVIQK